MLGLSGQAAALQDSTGGGSTDFANKGNTKQQQGLLEMKESHRLRCISKRIASRSREGIISLYSSLLRFGAFCPALSSLV